jgi:acetyl esterase/lipase
MIQAQQRIDLYSNPSGIRIGGKDSLADAPYMLHFKAPNHDKNKPAVLICPGGAYTMLASTHEGTDVAKFFNQQGFDAFVLMYRLNDYTQKGSRFPAQWHDVSTAMRMIKSNAAEYGLNANQVGILGFSAGGHLASMGSTLIEPAKANAKTSLDKIDSRPAFSILIYPVISLSDSFAHSYSGEMLLGKNASKEMKDSLSTYKRVNPNTPPAFIVFSADDTGVPPANGIRYYEALRRYGIKASLHIFDHGGHGYGMAPKDPVLSQWPTMAIAWLAQLGIKGNTEVR